MQIDKVLRPDAKGRICLGSIAKGISGYKATINEETQEIVLTPYTEIPLLEQWLFNNKEALDRVKRGLKQSSEHEVSYQGSFAEHVEKE